jgi:superfamily II DNA/RNA helicase
VLVLDEADRMLDMGFAEDVLSSPGSARPSARPCCSPPPAAAACAMVAKVLREPEHLQLNRVSELNEDIRQQVILPTTTAQGRSPAVAAGQRDL